MDNHLLDIAKKICSDRKCLLARALSARIPGCQSRSYPLLSESSNHGLEVFDGGHAAFLEDPDRFEPALRRFLLQGCETDFVPGN
jgi:pimeloyl-ACP methyl ester carboxylesterase